MTAAPDPFDVIVVGAGPAGSAAALAVARAGLRVALLERGPFPGSKNMYGGVIYGRVLDQVIPNWWDEIPIQRWITRRGTMILTPTQSLCLDFRSQTWAGPPYNGATALRPDFDAWLAAKAEAAGSVLVTSTVATDVVRDPSGRVVGVVTDRPDPATGASTSALRARVVIACDGVNSFIAKAAGLYPGASEQAEHTTLGVKEVLRLPRESIEQRFNLTGREGADFEVVGCTMDVPGGGFLYTNLDTISVGVVLHLPGLAASKHRPEEILAGFKAHPSIAPFVAGGEIVEYSAHLIPEGGYDQIPTLAGDGLLVAGDAAGLCLAAGVWLEGVNFAIGSGLAAGATAVEAIRSGDTTAARGLAGYRARLEANFVLADHKKLRRVPEFLLSGRAQFQYPQLTCDVVEDLFTVRNPAPKQGIARLAWKSARRSRVRLRDLARDGWTAIRSYG